MMNTAKKLDEASITEEAGPRVEFIPRAGSDFVVTPYIEDLTQRALAYLTIGYAVHLSGPAGTGKSTLAMHIASKLGQACTLLHGDDEFKASDLLGKDSGYERNSVVDNYVSSIVKTQETLSVVWTSNRLTTACQQGHTLIYDEFTRSPATANNPFLSILEEGILNIPSSGKEKGYIKVHPNFRAIFTSNPEEYVGVHKTQDALLDRMITMRLDYQDAQTEAAIVCAKSNRSKEDADSIVRIIRSIRSLLGGMNGPTVRAAIAIAKILDLRGANVDPNDPVFITTCKDVLCFQIYRNPKCSISASKFDTIIQHLGGSPEPDSFTTRAPDGKAVSNSGSPANNHPHGVSDAADQNESVKVAETTTSVEASGESDSATGENHPTPSLSTSDLEDTDRLIDETSVYQATAELQSALSQHVAETSNASRLEDSDESPWSVPNGVSTNAQLGSEGVRQEQIKELCPPVPRPSVNTNLPTPPVGSEGVSNINSDIARLDSETASPRQMLEAAVSRFMRPPKANDSESRDSKLASLED